MPRKMKRWTVLLAALCAALLLGGTASAALRRDTTTVTATEGIYVRVLIAMPDGSTLREHSVRSGEVAPGLVLRAEGTGLALVGTPTARGSWSVLIGYRTDKGEGELTVDQFVVAAPVIATATPIPSPVPDLAISVTVSPMTAAPAAETPAPATAVPTPAETGTPVPTATPTPTPAPTPTPTPAPENTPEPTLAPSPEGQPSVTKDPTGETVTEGGTAIFVARAWDAVDIQWLITDSGGGESMDVLEAAARNPGLRVFGQGSESLTLSGIPASMNGWQIFCRFIGKTGASVDSAKAAITVRQSGVSCPVILQEPEGTDLFTGETTTLTVNAVPPDGAVIHYQWYVSDRYDLASVRAIEGATENSYEPPFTLGTLYYCVGVRSALNWEESSVAYSDLAAVSCQEGVRIHTHDFTGPWQTDSVFHWHECSCGERQDLAAHAFTWTETRKATLRREGMREGVCTVCGYESVESLPAVDSTGLIRILLVILVILVAGAMGAGLVRVLRRNRRRRRAPMPRSRTYRDPQSRRR